MAGATEALEKHRAIRESHEELGRLAGVTVGILAALLAIASLVGSQASSRVILDQERATDTYNEYQADSLKQRIGTNDGAILAALGQTQAATAANQDAIDKGARKDPLLRQARAYEADRDVMERRDRNYMLAEAVFQLAIVLVSIALVAQLAPLALAGAGLGVIGLLLLLNGFTLAVQLPG